VSVRRAVLIGAFLAALGLPDPAAAEETGDAGLGAIVAVRDVRADRDQVSGVLVNLSDKTVHDIRILVTHSFLWANERHPGEAADNPGRGAAYAVPGEIPPGGRLSFTYRFDPPLPQRSDGRFQTSVSVVSLERIG
jgi:hypothetical protein